MRKLISIFLIGFSIQLYAQVAPAKYLVKFTDKDQSPFSLTQPENFLSQRALDRRDNQGIEIDITDIPINPVYIQGVAGTGAKLIIQVKWINALIVETESQAVLDAITSLSYVSEVSQINKRFPANKSVDKFLVEYSIPLKSNQSDPIYGDAYNQINMVNGIPLHESGFKGAGKVIAILDAGFINADVRSIFNSLWENNKILGSYNFVDPSSTVFGFHAHGTLVLSVMGGSLDGLFLGTAPEADYWLLRTEDTSSEFLIEEYNWIAGAAFADSVGADIINSSVGYMEFDDASYNHVWTDLDGNTTPITNAADLAAAKGIVVVNSAGNEGVNAWKYIIAPADGDSVFSIGAVDANGLITGFSSSGFEWDSRIKPNVVAQGGGTVLANENSDAVKTASGTSFSAPLIAGMMACLWQAIPDAYNMELIHAVEQSASMYSNPDNRYGYGIPDFTSAQLILGISDKPDKVISFEILPNPVFNTTLIRWDQNENDFEWLELLDLQGRLLFREELKASRGLYNLSLDGYENGIYFLRLGNQSQMLSRKIIKIN